MRPGLGLSPEARAQVEESQVKFICIKGIKISPQYIILIDDRRAPVGGILKEISEEERKPFTSS
jgi:hypothetical protein